ncbi:MAG TPA: DinB family protein [Chitinophagaceae bacterium]|nr:DinB family protein [Chitinophagaceae bacterium]
MKTIYDKEILEELNARINALNESSTARWGKMNVYEMLRHNVLWEELMLGKMKYKRVFIGRIFGKMALNNLIRDDKPIKQNMPTLKGFAIKAETGNIETEKHQWIDLLKEHTNSSATEFFHPFFGHMTKAQAGYLAYKHTDHHLRQFGV